MQFMFLILLFLATSIVGGSETTIHGHNPESTGNTGTSTAAGNADKTGNNFPEFATLFATSGRNIPKLIMELMSSHFSISHDYLFASKFFGSQYAEHPGMTKLLVKESDRHWEEGVNVLKKYLQLRGTTSKSFFTRHLSFTVQNDFNGQIKSNIEPSSKNYTTSLKTMVEKSDELLEKLTALNHKANKKGDEGGNAALAHFIQEKAEEELEVARKVVGYYMTLQNMDSLGIALDTFDMELKASL